jgi:hypothetical protein
MERITDQYDPRRCQWVIPTRGQCINVSVEDQNYCLAHIKNKLTVAKKRSMSGYRLTRYKAEVQNKVYDSEVKGLRAEIGILRQLIEERFNMINHENDLLLHSGPIADMISKVEKLVSSCNRIEEKLNITLDKNTVIQIAQEIVEILGELIEDQDVLCEASERICTVIEERANGDEIS